MKKIFLIAIIIIIIITAGILLIIFHTQKQPITEIKQQELTKEEVINYLFNNVSELKQLGEDIEEKSEGKARLMMYVEAEPNAKAVNEYEKNYYQIYVGESHETHKVMVYRFLIHKNTKEILYIDPITFTPISLEEWRANSTDR